MYSCLRPALALHSLLLKVAWRDAWSHQQQASHAFKVSIAQVCEARLHTLVFGCSLAQVTNPKYWCLQGSAQQPTKLSTNTLNERHQTLSLAYIYLYI